MSEKNAPPAPPGVKRPQAKAEEEPENSETTAKQEAPLPVQEEDTRPPGGSQMGEGARLDTTSGAETQPRRDERAGVGNPYADLPKMSSGFYRKAEPGRIRNPVSGRIYTNSTATEVLEPDSWDRSQLKAGIIAEAPGNQNRSV